MINTCSTIWGCATIKINDENKVICTQIVMHCTTIRICTTNQVNTVCKIKEFNANIRVQNKKKEVLGQLAKYFCKYLAI